MAPENMSGKAADKPTALFDAVHAMDRVVHIGLGLYLIGAGGALVWRALTGPAVRARLHRDKVEVRLWIVARPGQPLVPLTTQVRSAVAATVERLLGLELGGVTVLVDGVGV